MKNNNMNYIELNSLDKLIGRKCSCLDEDITGNNYFVMEYGEGRNPLIEIESYKIIMYDDEDDNLKMTKIYLKIKPLNKDGLLYAEYFNEEECPYSTKDSFYFDLEYTFIVD